ncbi:MAG: hypothetical protein AB8G17_04755 [Gammaproteobacteria bacterium]
MNDNPYESPQAELTERANRTPTTVYTPGQIAAGSFWGGPLATVYLLHTNYESLGNATLASRTRTLGIIFLVGLMLLLMLLPSSFPSIVVPLVYSMVAHGIANETQLSKQQINASDDYRRYSNWRVFGIGCLTLVLFFVLAVPVLMALEALGLVSLEA